MSSSYKLETIIYLLFGVFMLFGALACQSDPVLFKREFSEAEKLKITDQMVVNIREKFGQGSVAEAMVVDEGIRLYPQKAELYRVKGIPYLKRGFPVEFQELYSKAVALDPVNWQGHRGYMYLYFYRDYKRAIADFDAADALTPNFVDYPQATSVHFMRGVAYMGLGDYETALDYFDKHITEELRTTTEDFIDLKTFVFKGIAHYKKGEIDLAKESFARGNKNTPYNADLWYWTAKLAQERSDKVTATKAIEKAEIQFKKEYFNNRPYVEEFFQIYKGDIEELKEKINAL